jgi:hypothetical protein
LIVARGASGGVPTCAEAVRCHDATTRICRDVIDNRPNEKLMATMNASAFFAARSISKAEFVDMCGSMYDFYKRKGR